MILPCIYFIIKQMKMQTYIPKICSIFSLDKQMFVYYDTDIQTAVRNKCSHVMEGVYEKQKKKREKAEISFFDRIINGTIYNNVFRMFWYDPGTGGWWNQCL